MEATALSTNRTPSGRLQAKKLLLICGILSSLWYIAINVYVPAQYEGYRVASYTVSELSAIGAPTRQLWLSLVIAYPVLFAAFGWGVLLSSRDGRLRVTGGLIIAYAIFNAYWPPMHMRGIEPTLTDTLHIAWAMTVVLLMIAMMVLAALALGKRFRIYTISTIVMHLIFGVLSAFEAPNIPRNDPTPMIGIWERINIGVFMIWVIVLAIVLSQEERSAYKKVTTNRTPEPNNKIH